MGHSAVGTDFQESNGCWDNLKLGPMVFGTKCSWDFWSLVQFTFFLGHMCVGTKCSWDFWFLGQISGVSDIFGTKCYWDNSPSD